MNDQLVKDLARKAGLIAPYGSDREGLRDFDYRMFAELIVQECAEVAHCNFHVDGLTLGGIMKKHFGVEE
jgi:hypothetical protein